MQHLIACFNSVNRVGLNNLLILDFINTGNKTYDVIMVILRLRISIIIMIHQSVFNNQLQLAALGL